MEIIQTFKNKLKKHYIFPDIVYHFHFPAFESSDLFTVAILVT